MKYIFYIVISFLQPICWPLPEMATILIGVELIGSLNAFIFGYISIIVGIAFMYKITYILSDKYLIKFRNKPKFKKFQKFIMKNEVLSAGLLFILPILPDEIICIGSAITGIKFKTFMIIAIFAKFICIGLYAFSSELSILLNINQYILILIELILIFMASYIYEKKKNN